MQSKNMFVLVNYLTFLIYFFLGGEYFLITSGLLL